MNDLCAQIHKHGGTVQPTFDAATTTHIVSETSQQMTLRALGLKSLSEIPQAIPTVKWAWVISGKPVPGEKDRREMDYEFMHAAFPSRMDAGRSFTAVDRGYGKQKAGSDDNAYVWPFFSFRRALGGAHWVGDEVRELSLRRHARLRAVLAKRSRVSCRWTCTRRSVEAERQTESKSLVLVVANPTRHRAIPPHPPRSGKS